jgi:hypothetical protein
MRLNRIDDKRLKSSPGLSALSPARGLSAMGTSRRQTGTIETREIDAESRSLEGTTYLFVILVRLTLTRKGAPFHGWNGLLGA